MGRLQYDVVRSVSRKVNVALGVGTQAGYPVDGDRNWKTGALVLEQINGSLWEIAVVTNKQGGTASVLRGTLRECYNYLKGMHSALTLIAGNPQSAGNRHAA